MQSEHVRQLLDTAITNFTLDCERDWQRYERCADALGTRMLIARVKALDKKPAESLNTYTRRELEAQYRWLSTQFRHAVVEAAEYKALTLALDTKMSLVAGLIEEAFTKYVPQPESPALLFEVCGVSSQHKVNTPQRTKHDKVPYLKIVK